jgi:hypothetical protein
MRGIEEDGFAFSEQGFVAWDDEAYHVSQVFLGGGLFANGAHEMPFPGYLFMPELDTLGLIIVKQQVTRNNILPDVIDIIRGHHDVSDSLVREFRFVLVLNQVPEGSLAFFEDGFDALDIQAFNDAVRDEITDFSREPMSSVVPI